MFATRYHGFDDRHAIRSARDGRGARFHLRGAKLKWLLLCALAPMMFGCAPIKSLFGPAPPPLLLHITDRSGSPLPGAYVYLLGAPIAGACACVPDGGACGETDLDGYVLLLPPRDCTPIRLTVGLPGYEPGHVLLQRMASYPIVSLRLGPTTRTSPSDTVARHPASQLFGKIIDTAGRPIIGATIRFAGTKQGGYSKRPEGAFLLHDIRPGTYDIEVTAVGYRKAVMTGIVLRPDTGACCLVQLRAVPLEELERSVVIGCRLDLSSSQLRRGQAATSRAISPEGDPPLPSRSPQEAVRLLPSIRYIDPEGMPR